MQPWCWAASSGLRAARSWCHIGSSLRALHRSSRKPKHAMQHLTLQGHCIIGEFLQSRLIPYNNSREEDPVAQQVEEAGGTQQTGHAGVLLRAPWHQRVMLHNGPWRQDKAQAQMDQAWQHQAVPAGSLHGGGRYHAVLEVVPSWGAGLPRGQWPAACRASSAATALCLGSASCRHRPENTERVRSEWLC